VDIQALKERLRDFEHVIDTMNCGLVARDHDGILNFANQKILDWLGYERDEILGRPIVDPVPPELRAFLIEEINDVESGDLRARLIALQRKDSTTFPALTIPQRFLGADGKPEGYFAIVVDLGTVFTARQMGPAEPVDVRSTRSESRWRRIAMRIDLLKNRKPPGTSDTPRTSSGSCPGDASASCSGISELSSTDSQRRWARARNPRTGRFDRFETNRRSETRSPASPCRSATPR
jgi:PAS domain S-box-containing protein